MKTEEQLLDYLKVNKGGLILFNSLGCQRLINYDSSIGRLNTMILKFKGSNTPKIVIAISAI